MVIRRHGLKGKETKVKSLCCGNLGTIIVFSQLGLFQKLSSGGGPQALFCPVGGVDNVSEEGGLTPPGGEGVFDP